MTKDSLTSEPVESVTVPAEIQQLLKDRATFQGWLDKLSGLSQRFRPEVATRVEQDYRERLKRVESELASHRAEIESTLAERRSQARELADRRDQRAAELEEVELRHAVGELPDRDWERQRRGHEEALAGLDRSIEREQRAVTELEGILADLSGDGRPTGAPEPRASEAPAGEGPAASEVEEAAASAEEEPAAAAASQEGDLLDELEFLDSLSLQDAGRFDAVSRMLEEAEEPRPER
ncbi:MAG: hypothetical protein ACE5JR_04680 [Gemmatimonadota bacterium]